MVKFSIITPAKNAEKFINKNIESVLKQKFIDFEHLIILNKDDFLTKERIKKIKDSRIKLFIVQDDGPYDAMNFGISRSIGEFITVLNSDDYFYDNEVLQNICNVSYQEPLINYFYGNINITKNNKIFRKWNSGCFMRSKFFLGWHPPHPSLFVKKKDLDFSEDIFDKRFKISADYEFMLRYFVKYKKKALYINKLLVTMRHGGLSSKSLRNIIFSNLECYFAWCKNGYYFVFYIILIKPLKKLTQLIY